MTATTHPSSLDLEAFACGEHEDGVSGHLDLCDACRAFVERVKGVVKAGPKFDFKKALAARTETPARVVSISDAPKKAHQSTPKKNVRNALWVLVPLVAAAALLVFVLRPKEELAKTAPSATPSLTVAQRDPDPETTFKGMLQVAVIRERNGEQARFTGTVKVRAGDRLRVEVALDRDQAILGGVLGEDGSYLELMPGNVRGAGTHFSEISARVDSTPTRGTILIGAPDAVARARETKIFEGVSVIRVEIEP